MSREEVEDGMGFSGLAPSPAEQREDRERSQLRAEIARLQTVLRSVYTRCPWDAEVREALGISDEQSPPREHPYLENASEFTGKR